MNDRYHRYQALPFPSGNAVMLPLRPLPLPMGGNVGNADPDTGKGSVRGSAKRHTLVSLSPYDLRAQLQR